jgi:hypothetical protein
MSYSIMEMDLLVSDLLVIHAHVLTSRRYFLPTRARHPPIPHAKGCRCTGLRRSGRRTADVSDAGFCR